VLAEELPFLRLQIFSPTRMHYENTLDFARSQDAQDALRPFRDQFVIPQHEATDALYFCGNSLGLQPKTVRQALLNELDQWATHGVEGHFRGALPWMHYHKFLTQQSARLVGALPHEVVVMNTLTVNLHLAMVSFYRPTPGRYKIIMEAGAFPSDQYAMESQVRWHGLEPDDAIIEVAPRPGSDALRTDDIVQIIEKEGDTVALVLFGGVNYYTGQFYELEKIAAAAHRAGAFAGFDLAHAAGNLPLQLHDWNADFAVWCSYKYLNSGPGGPAGFFVHARRKPGASPLRGLVGARRKRTFSNEEGIQTHAWR
jgi:kynureninase